VFCFFFFFSVSVSVSSPVMEWTRSPALGLSETREGDCFIPLIRWFGSGLG